MTSLSLVFILCSFHVNSFPNNFELLLAKKTKTKKPKTKLCCVFSCARIGIDTILFLWGLGKRYPTHSREMTCKQVNQQKITHHRSFNSSQEPVGWVSQKRTDYDIQLFSCMFSFFFFFFYQLKEYKQRKIIFSFALGLKKASRDQAYKGPSLCIKTGSTVQTERSFENLLPQPHKRKKT